MRPATEMLPGPEAGPRSPINACSKPDLPTPTLPRITVRWARACVGVAAGTVKLTPLRSGTPPGQSNLAFESRIATPASGDAHSIAGIKGLPLISGEARKSSMRLSATLASTADVTMFGNIVSGKRRTPNSDRAANAVFASSWLPSAVYTENVATPVSMGATVKKALLMMFSSWYCLKSSSSRLRMSVTRLSKDSSQPYIFNKRTEPNTSFVVLMRSSFTFINLRWASLTRREMTETKGTWSIMTARPAKVAQLTTRNRKIRVMTIW
mmetsp:Transcript_12330/g.36628  ORF Transcript_12330/g.36628 Transcript_12330/m.36628 type:complete len:267 (+) Transcript_12330:2415-3215(+)